MTIETVDQAKTRAKNLRNAAAESGETLSHSQALERVAKEQGARDWNTLHARLANQRSSTEAFQIEELRQNGAVEGRYMGQAFTGMVRDLAKVTNGYRIEIHLDEPIDTVTFASFSNIRRRVRAIIDKDGQSADRSSLGVPHMIIDRVIPS